jgi:hypothetical protein
MQAMLGGSTGPSKPGICDMSLGAGTAMPFSFRRPKLLSYQTFGVRSSDSTAYEFTLDIGAAASKRYVIVGVAARSTSTAAHTIGAVVVNNTTATINIQSATTSVTAGIVTALVTDTTSATITVTFSTVTTEQMKNCAIAVWRAENLNSATAAATTNSAAVPATASLTGVAGGFAVGVAARNVSQTATWSGLTSRAQISIAGSDALAASFADAYGSSFSITGTYSNSTGSTSPSAVFAAF